MAMSKPITVPCQYVSNTPCGNRTTNHTGLCPKHRNSMPLKDIHNGIGGKPLLTAIPRVGPVLTTELKYTNDDFSTNEELVERLVEVEERRKYASPSLLTRIRNPKKVSEWSKKIEEEKTAKEKEDWEYRQVSGHTVKSTSSGKSRSSNSTSSSDASSDSAPVNVSSDPINGTFDIFFGN